MNVIDDQKCKKYYFLHFPKNIPVINKDRSIFAGNMVVKVVLDTQLVSHLSIFTLPDEVGRTLFVSEKLKIELEKNEITGIEFKPIEISFNEWYVSGGEREKIYGKV